MKRSAVMLALFSSLALCLGDAQVGSPAPEFTATDINGKTHRLSDYKGKVVVLEAYNLDCPYCHHHYETGAMQDLQKDLTSKGVIWFVVNSTGAKHPSHRDSTAAQKEWASQKMQATAWLDDSQGTIGKAYGMRTTPHVFVVDQVGQVAYEGAIDDRAATEGDPRKARNYVKEAVQSIMAGEKVKVTQTKPYGCGVKYGA